MSDKKQSSVKWLVKIYLQTKKIDSFDIEQAKAMHKEEISNAFSYFGDEYVDEKHCQEYYDQTFNSDEA